mgnify:CR=1 FL=1
MAVEPLNTVGHDVPRVDAYERVTGKATYTRDIKLPGMLYARVLRSTVPHARIRRIDTSKAAALPGVRAVITHETHQLVYGSGSISGGRQYNDAIKDITKRLRHMFPNPVRFVGQPVAMIPARDGIPDWDHVGRLLAEWQPDLENCKGGNARTFWHIARAFHTPRAVRCQAAHRRRLGRGHAQQIDSDW